MVRDGAETFVRGRHSAYGARASPVSGVDAGHAQKCNGHTTRGVPPSRRGDRYTRAGCGNVHGALYPSRTEPLALMLELERYLAHKWLTQNDTAACGPLTSNVGSGSLAATSVGVETCVRGLDAGRHTIAQRHRLQDVNTSAQPEDDEAGFVLVVEVHPHCDAAI